MSHSKLLYHGSVKDVLGPLRLASGVDAVAFEYSDAYSVFDWGRMPDLLACKGEALAILAAHWFEKLENPETWREFSKTPEALELRRGNRFGTEFIELGEKLQKEGLRTHYLGLAHSPESEPQSCLKSPHPVRYLVVKQVAIEKPKMGTVLGRAVPEYKASASHVAKLIPLEVVFRFKCPPGSSLVGRVAADPSYLVTRGFNVTSVDENSLWHFPLLEMFTKLESSDRPVGLSEGLAISGISADQLNEVLFKTAWVSALLRHFCSKKSLELADGKLEWAVEPNGQIILVDAVGPDELRILKKGIQLSKEFLRGFYRNTPWYEMVTQAKQRAEVSGIADWKKTVTLAAPVLHSRYREIANNLYPALTNHLTGREWFKDAWELERVIQNIEELG